MTVAQVAALLTSVGLSVAAILTWATARRKASGRIDTTEAEKLWDALREWNAGLQASLLTLRAEHQTCIETQLVQAAEISSLRSQLAALAAENGAIRSELAGEASRAHAEIARLRAKEVAPDGDE